MSEARRATAIALQPKKGFDGASSSSSRGCRQEEMQ